MVTDSSYGKTKLNSLKFEKGGLVSVLQVINLEKLKFSGYFRITFDDSQESDASNSILWHLFFSKGKIVFSSCQEIKFADILHVLQNYIPSFRSSNLKAQPKINEMIFLAKEREDISILRLLTELTLKTKIIEYQEITKAIKKHLFNDFDRYLFNYSGNVKIIFDKTIDLRRPIVGFDLEQILFMVQHRKTQWKNLSYVIPSMDYFVGCNNQNPKWENLPSIQKQKVEKLVASGKTLEDIRYNLGEDSLKIAQTFAKLIQKEFIVISSSLDELLLTTQSLTDKESVAVSSPEIVIIDDSPVLLKQFSNIVTGWGYKVRCCNDALSAVDFLLQSPPDLIFLDVNMPNLSGFQLMKMIRMQPQLNSIPLVVLTAEKTMMNRQRAKWSKSIFLTKPLNSGEISRFKSDLKILLQKMVSLTES